MAWMNRKWRQIDRSSCTVVFCGYPVSAVVFLIWELVIKFTALLSAHVNNLPPARLRSVATKQLCKEFGTILTLSSYKTTNIVLCICYKFACVQTLSDTVCKSSCSSAWRCELKTTFNLLCTMHCVHCLLHLIHDFKYWFEKIANNVLSSSLEYTVLWNILAPIKSDSIPIKTSSSSLSPLRNGNLKRDHDCLGHSTKHHIKYENIRTNNAVHQWNVISNSRTVCGSCRNSCPQPKSPLINHLINDRLLNAWPSVYETSPQLIDIWNKLLIDPLS